MKITKRLFGTLKDGTQVHCWTMENNRGLRAELLDYGATIRAIEVPARGGRTVDVVLGYDTLEGYTENGGYFGATIGRFGNRIGGGAFTLNGKTYTLARNNGENHLHGGQKGFDKYVWDAEQTEDGLLFSRVSPRRRGGLPRHAHRFGAVFVEGRRAFHPLPRRERPRHDPESDEPQLF